MPHHTKGNLSKIVFGTKQLPKNCLFFAGMLYPEKEISSILKLFDSSTKLSDFQPVLSYVAEKNGKEWLLCFGAYGGTSALEITNLLNDGLVKNVYFIGWAGTQKQIQVGTINIPKKVKCLDGITKIDSQRLIFTLPSKQLMQIVTERLKEKILIGNHITIPGLSILHRINKVSAETKKYDTIDTELSVVLHFAKKNKMNAVGIMIITDTQKQLLTNQNKAFVQKTRYETLRQIVDKLA